MRSADGNARPITADDAVALFSLCDRFHHILLAVSGGADSIALMALARDWAKSKGRQAPKLSVATVDHGLRKAAAEEALLVARFAKTCHMPHATLHWRGAKPKAALQEKARAARYDLLLAHAREIGADAIALAHHADDQAETVLMRLASGSGLTGLSGMKAMSMRNEIALIRPLLDLPAAQLRATLRERKIAFVDDPSNANEAFTRIRLRHARDVLAAEGLTRDRLVSLAHRMTRADQALRVTASAAERRHLMPSETGVIFAHGLFAEPLEVVIRVIGNALARLAFGDEPMLQRLENCVLNLLAAYSLSKPAKKTLNGAILSLSADGRLTIKPESSRRKV